MPRFGVWDFPLLMDAPDAGGGGASADTPVAAEVETSLAEHEAAFVSSGASSGAPAATDPASESDAAADATPAAERRADGTFKPRHRAKSQQASPEDSPRIQELTRRRHEAETERDALRAERDALRAERETVQRPAAAAAEPEPTRPAPARPTFPTYDEWVTVKGHEHDDVQTWYDARDDWRYDQRKAAEQAEVAAHAEQRTYSEHVTAYRDKIAEVVAAHPDFEAVTAATPRISKVMERAVIAVGPAAAYYLATHPEECAALTADTLVYPDNPAFAATVAATRRYLSTLVASPVASSVADAQRPASPSRAAAVSTGSALALVPATTPPKPPSPVRTGALHTADDPPGDGSSLAEHERFYVKTARR